MESKPKYGTVPIMLLRDIHTDQAGTIRKMFCYAIYDRMRKNYPMLEHDDFESSGIGEELEYFNLPVQDLERYESIFNEGKILYDTFNGTPTASMNIQDLLRFSKEKTEYELMVFSFYCAVRSMIGKKPYFLTNDNYWLSRAFGYATIAEYQNANPTQAEKDMRVKYSKRYWLDKIKLELQDNWYLVYVSTNQYFKVRGFYVSLKMTLHELFKIAKTANVKYKSKSDVRKKVIANAFAGNNDVPF